MSENDRIDETWRELMLGVPSLKAATASLGSRGGDRMADVRQRAAALDVDGCSVPDIAWQLQLAASSGAGRDALRREYARREERIMREQRALAAVKPTRSSSRPALTASKTHIAVFIAVLIVGFFGPALVMPSPRGRGFIADVDDVALLSGLLSLMVGASAIGYGVLWRSARISRPLAGPAIPIILGIWTGIAGIVAAARLADLSGGAQAASWLGVALFAIACILDVVAAARLRGPRRAAATAPSLNGAEEAALISAMLGGDAHDDETMMRRVAFAHGVRTLMRRRIIDDADARTLLEHYAV